MKIYLAGPMTGIPDHNFPAFDTAAAQLREAGHTVFSPADMSREIEKVGNSDGTISAEDYAACMRMDLICILEQCDTIYVLDNWQQSRGARLEVLVAQTCGIPVYDTRHKLVTASVLTGVPEPTTSAWPFNL